MALHKSLSASGRGRVVPVIAMGVKGLDDALRALPARAGKWAGATGFSAKAGEVALVADDAGKLDSVLFGLGDGAAADPFIWSRLPGLLPDGLYRIEPAPQEGDIAALAWVLGTYAFTRYRDRQAGKARLVLPDGADGEEVTRIAQSVFLARDLINTPANDMGPEELEKAVRALARPYKARVQVVRGKALLDKGFPLVHAVGKGSAREPRLIDLRWGGRDGPRITLIGKGVCFDSGGLDLKTASGMVLMKKDMGGAANAMALARMIMDAGLPVRLRLIVPAVENSVSGEAFRPGDIYPSRKGLTVEIGNTDAEGRLVLADALALADEEKPDLLVDLATLTGAARVALGPDLPAFFADDDLVAEELAALAGQVNDPLWRLPLWRPYAAKLDSPIADINHISSDGFAGAITAALFLKRFVDHAASWLHFDIFAWSPEARPGRPKGGEAQAIRALYALIKQRYGR